MNLIAHFLFIIDSFLHGSKTEHISAMFPQESCHDHCDNKISLAAETQSLYITEFILSQESDFPELILDVTVHEWKLGVAEFIGVLETVRIPRWNLN